MENREQPVPLGVSSSLGDQGLKKILNSEMMNLSPTRIENRTLFFGDKIALDFSTSCYLGTDFDVDDFEIEQVRKNGTRNGWSRISGSTPICISLEDKLSSRFGDFPTRIAPSISLINFSVFSPLVKIFSSVFVDYDAHITLKSGVKSAFKSDRVTVWSKLDQLKDHLATASKQTKPHLIVTDGIYSMKGSTSPIPELLELCEKYNAYLYIDDAHGFGVCGKNGLGVLDHYSIGMSSRIIYTGSFSKCTGHPVAFLICQKEIMDILSVSSAFMVYTGPPSNFHAAAAFRHLQLFNSEHDVKRKRIRIASEMIHRFLDSEEISYISSPGSPIVCVRLSRDNFSKITAALFEHGIIAKVVIYPVVRKGFEVARFSITALHTENEILFLQKTILKMKDLFL